jgi:hypothetical protein
LIVVLGGDSGLRAPKAFEIIKSIEHSAKGIGSNKTNVLIIGTAGQAKEFATKCGMNRRGQPLRLDIQNTVSGFEFKVSS